MSITVNAVHRRVQYVGNGSNLGAFSFNFKVLAATDIKVSVATTVKTVTTHYTTSLNADGTGSVTFTSGNAPANNAIITIESDQAIERTTDYSTGGDFTAESINDVLDRLTINDQQIETLLSRNVQLASTVNRTTSGTGTSGPLFFPYDDTVSNQANKIISFNSAGTALETSLTTGDIATATTKAGEAAASAADALNSKNAAATSATASANSATAAHDDGAAQVTLATAQVGLATTQANNAAASATAATNNGAAQVALAAAQVGLATTQAGLATTNGAAQVALATTQANNSAASAVTAASETTDAETAKTASEAAQVAAAASAAAAVVSANAAEAAAAAIFFEYETSTSMANPSAGGVRFNNASMGSVTQITFSATSASTGNPDVSDYITRWDDSTSPVKGHIIIRESGAPGSSIVFAVSGSITDNTTHLIVPVSHITSAGVSLSASDDLYFSFTRTGDAGDLSDPMTTRGDIIIRNASNALDRLGTGAANRVLISDGTDPSYGQVPLASAVSGILPLANGGTNANTAAAARTQLGLGTAAVAASTSFEAVDADILRADTADELTAGFSSATVDSGTKTGGTFTPSPDDGNFQHFVNGGAHTLGVPSKNCTLVLLMKNNVSAGTLTTSGFTVVDGDPLTTTNNHEFFLHICRYSDGTTVFSSLTVKALQ